MAVAQQQLTLKHEGAQRRCRMQDVARVHAELVVAGNAVTINILDESNKPTSPKGFQRFGPDRLGRQSRDGSTGSVAATVR